MLGALLGAVFALAVLHVALTLAAGRARAPTKAHPYTAAVCTSAELFAVYHSYAFLAP